MSYLDSHRGNISQYVTPSGEIIKTHPDEIIRVPDVYPHGFVDMNLVFDKYQELLAQADNKPFTTTFRRENFYLTLTSKQFVDTARPTNTVSIEFGTFEYGYSTPLIPGKLFKEVYGYLEMHYYCNAKAITVIRSQSRKGVPVSPRDNLGTIKQFNLLNLPVYEFEVLEGDQQ